ncbi:alcohol dehydrogenase catalytic domain-containing protein [Myceligenerans crystallogenes]|uniref:alcohol dehydrogenase catalytic domain-containing protein n=1 Tax=Myceligenerans crystallogenes TaxID=316335 RepID=UPI0031E2B5EB
MRVLTAEQGNDTPFVTDVAPPPLGPGDLRIRVAAAAINPADLFVTSGAGRTVFGLPPTVGLGWDAAGTVTETGADVTDFAVGDEVAVLHHDLAARVRAHAESLVVPASSSARIPDGLGLEGAATLPLNALTARQALDLLGPADGRTLLVTGAAGAVGGFAVALAVQEGWRVTGLGRSADAAFITRAGSAAGSAAGSSAGAAEAVTGIPGRAAFDAVLDAAALREAALAAVRDGGAYVGVLPPRPVPSERGITTQDVGVRPDGATLAGLLRLAAAGVLEPRVAGTAPLDEAAAAYAKVAAGGQRGRWLLIP